MSTKMELDLGNVQKTLLLPLWGRAHETQKTHPLLVDKAALAIIEHLSYDFTAIAENTHELTQLAWIMRSLLIDRTVCQLLAATPNAVVVNVGCGLDTTFERVDNGLVVWYDLDLPDVIALRRQFIYENPRRKFITASFLEPGWLDTIQPSARMLFIAAGVFYYFEEHEVRDFLVRLADRFNGSECIFDVCSPFGVKVANQRVIQSAGLDEKSFLKWGLTSPALLSRWDRRLQVLSTYFYFWQNAIPLPLRSRLLGYISDFYRIQYLVHLRLEDT